MRGALGHGYTETLRRVHDDVPESVDFAPGASMSSTSSVLERRRPTWAELEMYSRLLDAVRAGTVGAVALAVASCGYVGSDKTPELNVPFFAQQLNSFDCGPATVQMWTAYDHGTANLPSQQQISHFMGGTSLGTSPQKIADAVNFYTASFNAFVDLVAADYL